MSEGITAAGGSGTSSGTMTAVLASAFGPPQDVLTVSASTVRPQLSESKGKGKGQLLSGEGSLIKKPKAFPYIPGGDICGVVEQVGTGVTGFSVGDHVLATWAIFGEGGLAEYHIVDSSLAARKPANISSVDGAALANSAGQALQALKASTLQPGDRVLILGGSGGVGSALVQLAKRAGAAYVAATSTDAKLVSALGADRVVDHTAENWWKVQEFQDAPFDIIIDCAEGVKAWRAATRKPAAGTRSVFSPTGRFLAVVLNDWHIVVKQPWHLASVLLPPLGRQLWNTVRPNGRRYMMFLGGVDGKKLAEVASLVSEGELRVPLDPQSPFPLTEAGVKAAFELMGSRHAHGKVVIEVAK
jgi:NADPH:quinone reductase-like Zn-dependent oxidoreductase